MHNFLKTVSLGISLGLFALPSMTSAGFKKLYIDPLGSLVETRNTTSVTKTEIKTIDTIWLQRHIRSDNRYIHGLYILEPKGPSQSMVEQISMGLLHGTLKYFNVYLHQEHTALGKQIETENIGKTTSFISTFYKNNDVTTLPRFLKVCKEQGLFSESFTQHIMGLIPNFDVEHSKTNDSNDD